MNPILSILTPAVQSRWAQLAALCEKIKAQSAAVPSVEHLVLIDMGYKLGGLTVGEKRDRLLRMARGRYVAFVDDDDDIHTDYARELCRAMAGVPDVVTFEQIATINGQSGICIFGLGNPNEPFCGETFKRDAWHVCAWRRALAIQSSFPASNYGEDWAFAAPLCAIPNLKEVHIPKILHFYRHDSETTEAPPMEAHGVRRSR